MNTLCKSCGAQSSSTLCWACDDDEFIQVVNDAHVLEEKKRSEDIALLRSIVNDDECVDKLLVNPNYISDKLLNVDEELLYHITGKVICPRKKVDTLIVKLLKYANDPANCLANSLIIECVGRGNIKNLKSSHNELMRYITDNFDTNDLSSLMKYEDIRTIVKKNQPKAINIVTACAKDISSIIKSPKYDEYITSGRVDVKGTIRTIDEVKDNERSLRTGLALELLLSGKDINLKQGAQKRNKEDDKRRQGREYMVACMLVDVYKCMHDRYDIPAPLFGTLLRIIVETCGIKLIIKEDDFITRCKTNANYFRYAQYKKVKGYIEHMEREIKKLNGNKNEPYFRKLR